MKPPLTRAQICECGPAADPGTSYGGDRRCTRCGFFVVSEDERREIIAAEREAEEADRPRRVLG